MRDLALRLVAGLTVVICLAATAVAQAQDKRGPVRATPIDSATSVIVIGSSVPSILPGAPLDKTVRLNGGQQLTLMLPDGQLVTASGPTDVHPVKLAMSATGVVDPLLREFVRNIISGGTSGSRSIGALRAVAPRNADVEKLPFSLNLIPASASGTICVSREAPLFIGRGDIAASASVTVVNPQLALRESVNFAAGKHVAPWPRIFAAPSEGAQFAIVRAGQPMRVVRVAHVERVPESEMLRALFQRRCETQAAQLLRGLAGQTDAAIAAELDAAIASFQRETDIPRTAPPAAPAQPAAIDELATGGTSAARSVPSPAVATDATVTEPRPPVPSSEATAPPSVAPSTTTEPRSSTIGTPAPANVQALSWSAILAQHSTTLGLYGAIASALAALSLIAFWRANRTGMMAYRTAGFLVLVVGLPVTLSLAANDLCHVASRLIWRHDGAVTHLAVSTDGQMVATADTTGRIRARGPSMADDWAPPEGASQVASLRHLIIEHEDGNWAVFRAHDSVEMKLSADGAAPRVRSLGRLSGAEFFATLDAAVLRLSCSDGAQNCDLWSHDGLRAPDLVGRINRPAGWQFTCLGMHQDIARRSFVILGRDPGTNDRLDVDRIVVDTDRRPNADSRDVPALAMSDIRACAPHVTGVFAGLGERHLHVATNADEYTTRARFDCPDCEVIDNSRAEDGNLEYVIAGGRDGVARLWRLDRTVTGASMATAAIVPVILAHGASVTAVAFAPALGLALTGGSDGRIRLWDLETGTSVGSIDGHGDTITLLGATADGTVISAALDGEVRAAHIATARAMWTMAPHRHVAEWWQSASLLAQEWMLALSAPRSLVVTNPNAPADAPTPPQSGPAADPNATAEQLFDVIPVFYGTDRARDRDTDTGPVYGTERAGRLELGRALVTVPKTHEQSQIERPYVYRLPFTNVVINFEPEDRAKHIALRDMQAMDEAQSLAVVQERLRTATQFKDHALIFVHGFNTNFDFAIYRIAQIAYDMKFDGAPFAYSWPSKGGVLNYGFDRESAEQARRHLREFLDLVVKQSGAKKISIIAHSMGNYVLMPALEQLKDTMPEGVKFSQLILASPDVDPRQFITLIQSIGSLADGITLYAHGTDRALQISKRVWGDARAGDIMEDGPLIVDGVDTIDITPIGSQIPTETALINDMRRLLATGIRPPDQRSPVFIPVETSRGRYWRRAPN